MTRALELTREGHTIIARIWNVEEDRPVAMYQHVEITRLARWVEENHRSVSMVRIAGGFEDSGDITPWEAAEASLTYFSDLKISSPSEE